MEIRAFAEQVLFSSSLEEKLRAAPILTDEQPGPALAAPPMPGRPSTLQFKPQGSGGGSFPGLHQLEQVVERGRLLHFFANHELLATELMALVLLRFPDAPPAFRRGVAQTLQDEQEHTRWYMERMRCSGIDFGDFPVSGYFWRAISGMQNPMEYVAALSLTFEQANLDYARHFAAGFQTVGDLDTSRLLERIYRDEIGHVAYGLKWFRRWKNPDESDWAAFCRQLKFPLSPQRAKAGAAINVEGRRAAGLDLDFIDQLNVFSQSRGRTPGVFVFNPLAEGCIAFGNAFTPVRHQAQLVRDLENLPQFLCRQDDVVLVRRRPSIHFLSTIKNAGFPLPEFVVLEPAGRTDPAHEEPWPSADLRSHRTPPHLAARKLGRLRPWAWAPDSAALLEPLAASVTAGPQGMAGRFNPDIAGLYSKSWSAGLLRRVLEAERARLSSHGRDGEWPGWLCRPVEVGTTVGTMEEALAAIGAIRARGHHRIVLKQALGLAGRNALRLFEPDLLDPQRRWLAASLEQGRQVVVEPWLERVADFSAQLEMAERGLKLVGFTGLSNDLKGQFQANWAGPNWRQRIPAQVTAAFTHPPDIVPQIHSLYERVFEQLESDFRKAGFEGAAGIDAFVYRSEDGQCRLKPVVELNPRYTMGRLTLELMQHTAPGSRGVFRIVTAAAVRSARKDSAQPPQDLSGYARALLARNPARLEGQPVPRLREGALCLSDPETAEAFLATFEVTSGTKQ